MGVLINLLWWNVAIFYVDGCDAVFVTAGPRITLTWLLFSIENKRLLCCTLIDISKNDVDEIYHRVLNALTICHSLIFTDKKSQCIWLEKSITINNISKALISMPCHNTIKGSGRVSFTSKTLEIRSE